MERPNLQWQVPDQDRKLYNHDIQRKKGTIRNVGSTEDHIKHHPLRGGTRNTVTSIEQVERAPKLQLTRVHHLVGFGPRPNEWSIIENPTKMNDLGVTHFRKHHISTCRFPVPGAFSDDTLRSKVLRSSNQCIRLERLPGTTFEKEPQVFS